MTVSRVLIVDTETTGVESDAAAIEIGMILYSVTNRSVLQEFGTLLYSEANPQEQINRIKPAALQEMAELGLSYNPLVREMVLSADVIVAHNADFDSRFFNPDDFTGTSTERHWVCTLNDFEWPEAAYAGRSLIHLALAYDIPVASAHRALTDCRLIACLFDRIPNLEERFARAMRPKGTFRANVSFDDRGIAYDAGFRWKGKAIGWVRRVALEDVPSLPFPVTRIDDPAKLF